MTCTANDSHTTYSSMHFTGPTFCHGKVAKVCPMGSLKLATSASHQNVEVHWPCMHHQVTLFSGTPNSVASQMLGRYIVLAIPAIDSMGLYESALTGSSCDCSMGSMCVSVACCTAPALPGPLGLLLLLLSWRGCCAGRCCRCRACFWHSVM